MDLIFPTLNSSNSTHFNTGIGQFIADHTFLWRWLQVHGAAFLDWFKQPHVLAIVLAWTITFTVIFTLLCCLGFGPIGVIPGGFAAAFQSWAYGGFTPAAGVFATLTSLAMLGWLMPIHVGVAAVVATGVAVVVWTVKFG